MVVPLFCDGCGADYPERRAMSPFGILGLELTYRLAEDRLDTLESQLATRLHPDRWQGKGESLHRRALMAQSAVNEALEAVRGPIRRAETLLGLLPDAPEAGEETRPRLPTSFLVQQLELQEEIERGLESARKKELAKWVRLELKKLDESLESGFDALETCSAKEDREATIGEVQSALDRSRYWRNIQRSLRGRGTS